MKLAIFLSCIMIINAYSMCDGDDIPKRFAVFPRSKGKAATLHYEDGTINVVVSSETRATIVVNRTRYNHILQVEGNRPSPSDSWQWRGKVTDRRTQELLEGTASPGLIAKLNALVTKVEEAECVN